MYKIVLSGGPCGGKTTLSRELTPFLEQHGINVYKVHESATLFINAGIKPKKWTDEEIVQFQTIILGHQLMMEEIISEVAQKNLPSVLICDRGALDGKAYARPDLWAKILDQCGVTEEELHKQYDLIIHLDSAAIGAEEHYSFGPSSDSNTARYENLEEAIAADYRTFAAWDGHPNRVAIHNYNDDFNFKMEFTKQEILKRIRGNFGL